jgi:predicted phage baseplate assembly protein
MSGSLDPSIRGLTDCGCCSGLQAETPQSVVNRPGLSALAYRVGVHAQFRASMLAQLSTAVPTTVDPKIRKDDDIFLRTREDDDFSIALIDSWAALLDVLSFYQERIANESYFRTAVERRSLLELARLIGYELRPGVSATADLAFTLQTAPGTPEQVSIEIGTKVQSVPGPNELPQTFETVESIIARPEWNAIRPRQTKRHEIAGTEDPLVFAGIATNLKAGDGLLITPDDTSVQASFRQVATVSLQPRAADSFTSVTLQPLRSLPPPLPRIEFETAFEPGPIARSLIDFKLNVHLEPVYSAAELVARSAIFRFVPREVFRNLSATQPPPPSVLAFRARAAIFGHNAPAYAALTPEVKAAFNHWVNTLGQDEREAGPVPVNQYSESFSMIYLDTVYPGIVPNSFVVLKDARSGATQLFQVQDAVEVSKADFTLSLKVTRLNLSVSSPDELGTFYIRSTTVFVQSETLPLARDPIPDPVEGATIDLEGYVDGLSAGQRIIVSGESSDNVGVNVAETAIISNVTHNFGLDGFSSIILTSQLSNSYVRPSVTIYGNVARANNGESTSEILGTGDTSQVYQRFTLRQPPLTYVSSPAAPGGAASTLKIFVNGVQWVEVPTLDGSGRADRVFAARTGDDGNTRVIFGDGISGARLPSGQGVQAFYRKGIGLPGMVQAGQVSLLMKRPLGVLAVTNPQDAQGGEDRESLDNGRANAPLTIMTLDRIVSLDDYQNFAQAFAGIAKALATWTWSGQVRGVFVTVAGPDGTAVDPTGPAYANLLAAMRRFGDPHVPITVVSYRRALFQISARLVVAPDHLAEPQPVLDRVETTLRQTFSFAARSFGQPVALSEVMAVLQNVSGVQAAEVNALFRFGDDPGLNPLLPAAAPQPGLALVPDAAELLTLDPRPVDLGLI